jgi:hypothetical protein
MEDDKVPSEDIEFISGLPVRKTGFALPFEPKVSEYEFVLEENAPRSASEYTGPPKRPQDVPIMPLSAAIDCVASKGATDSFDRALFESAIVMLLDDVTVGDLFVSGQSHNKPAGIIPSEEFRGVVIAHPYQSGNEFNAAILHDGPVLDLCKNQLFVGRRLDWFDLMVAGRDISRFLPFEQEAQTAHLGQSKPSESAADDELATTAETEKKITLSEKKILTLSEKKILQAIDDRWKGKPPKAIGRNYFIQQVIKSIEEKQQIKAPGDTTIKTFWREWMKVPEGSSSRPIDCRVIRAPDAQ